MDFLPQRPKEIIRKYEQLDARDELNAACSEIANRISEKQKQRMDLHGALEDLVSKKTETKEDILKLQQWRALLPIATVPRGVRQPTFSKNVINNEVKRDKLKVNMRRCKLKMCTRTTCTTAWLSDWPSSSRWMDRRARSTIPRSA